MYAANILTVTQAGLLYRDAGGHVRWLDFAHCAHNAFSSTEIPSPVRLSCVGWRNTRALAVLDVVFFAPTRPRFIFESYHQRDSVLLNPLRAYGWYTWDISGNTR